jgi:hypothetical protein
MTTLQKILLAVASISLTLSPAFTPEVNAQTTLPSPKQDAGLPYTRSAQPRALAAIKDVIALYPGSRLAYAKGYRIRLDDTHWKDEAILKDGKLYVPASFAGVLNLKDITPDPAPDYLKDRWTYHLTRPQVQPPLGIDVDGHQYIDIADYAKTLGLKVTTDPSGLTLIGQDPQPITDPVLRDCVITLFDTPEKYANPDIATKYVPDLARQGKWTDHVKVTPEQLALLNGPETKWTYTPKSEYDAKGINTTLLGSPVPAPGVYPRILFSEADLPALAKHIKSSQLGTKSWLERTYLMGKSFYDANSSDGKVFQKLASNDLEGLAWPELKEGQGPGDVPHNFKDEKAVVHNSHVAYVPEMLTAMALQCLLENDDAKGKQVATAIANYYKLREPLIDQWLETSDSEFGSSTTLPDGKVIHWNGNGSSTHWRNIHGVVANMNLGLALDFGGKWMTPDQKALMQRVIAKATYGRRAYAQDGSPRFRDINWCGWDTPNYLALLAIEGLEGCDNEAIESNRETLKAFCEWGISPAGVVYESNGKTGGSFESLLMCFVADARRENGIGGAVTPGFFAHPHLRNLLLGQVQTTSPNGKTIPNSGTQYVPYSRQMLSAQFVLALKSFYPDERLADFILTNVARTASTDENSRYFVMDQSFDPKTYEQLIPKIPRLRMASVTYPSFVRPFLYDADYKPTTRVDLNLPLDFSDPVHGVFSAYSDNTETAAWINILVRPDHYLGAGHHHADAGMFHFSALGVDWITESPFTQNYAGKYHNLVLVDGRSEADSTYNGNGTSYQGAATYLGASTSPNASSASADLTYSYTWQWQTQPGKVWPEANTAAGGGGGTAAGGWEFDPSPEIARIFAGTARYKMRPWWPTSTWGNYIATSRAPFNPMQYVYRQVGMVRGEHPVAYVIDDLKKDDASRLYQWTACLNGGVWQAASPDLSNLHLNNLHALVLAYKAPTDPNGPDPKIATAPAYITPNPNDPLLLVLAVGKLTPPEGTPAIQVTREQGPADRQGKPQYYDRLSISHQGEQANFKVLLIPFRSGQGIPTLNYDPATSLLTLTQGTQKTRLKFTTENNRTTATVGGETALR